MLPINTTTSPLYYVRGGDISLYAGSLKYAGHHNFYWTSTTYPNISGAYSSVSSSVDNFPANSYSRFYGFSVRGGNVDLKTGSLRRASLTSNYWSTTTYPNDTYAYKLHFDGTSVYPSDYYYRFNGFSLRGGNVNLDTGSLRNASSNSNYWSVTTYPNAKNAYYLHSASTNVILSNYNNRFNGFSVRGGLIDLNTGSLRYADSSSLYWSATTYPNIKYAYHLDFDSTGVIPSNHHHRFHGFSVRGGYIYLGTGSLRYANLISHYWSSTTYPNATYTYYLHSDNANIYPAYSNHRFYGFSINRT